jgi:hypothetical protein
MDHTVGCAKTKPGIAKGKTGSVGVFSGTYYAPASCGKSAQNQYTKAWRVRKSAFWALSTGGSRALAAHNTSLDHVTHTNLARILL